MNASKIKTAQAWGYLCRDGIGKYTDLAKIATPNKPLCANPPVRVRIIREIDWKKIERRLK
jgi:hypothetical protein